LFKGNIIIGKFPRISYGGVADLRYESSLVGFLKPRPKLTFGYDAQLAFIP
jgi:hypothetical protein